MNKKNKTKTNTENSKLCKAFAGTCPVTDGVCLNPMCMFGCIEAMKESKIK